MVDSRDIRISAMLYSILICASNLLRRLASLSKKADAGNITAEDIQEAFDGPQGSQQLTNTVVR
jgi:hypothetical protein